MADDPIAISVDTTGFRREIGEADRLTRGFGRALGAALEGGVVKGRSLTDVLRGLGSRLSQLALQSALKPVENTLGSLFSNLTQNLFAGVTPFAKGGVLASPAVLPNGGAGLALAGEAGPEAVLPLARGADGRLGVASSGGARPAPITINIATPDVDSFRRAEGQLTATLARAVARGQRGL